MINPIEQKNLLNIGDYKSEYHRTTANMFAEIEDVMTKIDNLFIDLKKVNTRMIHQGDQTKEWFLVQFAIEVS